MTRRPRLHPRLAASEFRAWYWMKDELVGFLRACGLPTSGAKPELERRIERHLSGRPDAKFTPTRRAVQRDSDRPLTRKTRVVNYFSDDATRAFFRAEIGDEFHFTYHLNQFRLARTGLTYGDLIDEWLAERDRRRDPDYQAPLAAHGKWNLFVRAFFADPANRGRTIADAARAWNKAKLQRGDPRYTAGRTRRPRHKA